MAKRTVVLLGNEHVIQNEDDKAAAAITPGMLVNFDGSGNLVPHATVTAVPVAKTFALEREEGGQDFDVPYAIGETVKVGHLRSGIRIAAIIGVVNASKGSMLESDGTGKLRVLTTGTAIARSLEALNNASGTARLRVEIL
jgi:hypothetical protein